MLSAYYNNPFLADFCLGRLPLRLASRQSPLAVLQAHECLRKLQASLSLMQSDAASIAEIQKLQGAILIQA